jgi:uncharacterized hydrophobic protein (TIGR00271 family)
MQVESPTPATNREWRLLRRTVNALRSSIARLLRVGDERKPAIYTEVFRSSEFADLNYWLEIIFSIGIATLGLIINSPAVVIGAMLISPLMGPIIASGLAIALGDFYLGLKSITNLLLSILGSILLAATITWVLPFRTPTPEILARVQPTLLDLGVAVLSGMAGAIVFCRGGGGGGVTALPGVAVAVALMPPLGVVGFGVGIGWDWEIVRGGGLLFLTNLVAIILSSFLVFFAVRMDTPEVRRRINEWLEEEEKKEPFYEFIERTPLRRLLGKVGSLPRRALILFIFLAMVTLPLQQTLSQLRQEAQVRRVVLEELYRSIPRDAIFREDLEIQPERVRLRVVAVLPGGFSPERRRELESVIRARTERPAQVTVFDVATREEVSTLTGRLAAPAPPVETLEELRARLWTRIRPAIAAAWPAERAPLAGYALIFEHEAPAATLRLAYLSDHALGELGEEAVRKMLRERLGSVGLDVKFEQLLPQAKLRFPRGSDALTADARRELDWIALVLERFPGLRCAFVAGEQQADDTAPLDAKRIENIRGYLGGKKAGPERILVEPAPHPGERDTVVARLVAPAQP